MTTLQFAQWLWTSAHLEQIEIGIWVIITVNFLERRFGGKIIYGQEGQIISPQKESLGSVQHLHKNKRLPKNNRKRGRGNLRNMSKALPI